jgi:hypothetical protein
MTNAFMTPSMVLRATEVLVGLAIIVSSAEMIARRTQLTDGGLLSWKVSRTRAAWLEQQSALSYIFEYPRVLAVVWARVAAGVVLILPVNGKLHFASAIALFVSSVLLTIRTPVGNDGADQMTTIVLAGVVAAHACKSFGVEAAFWFIAVQACMSYGTSGIAKLVSPEWRSGQGLIGVMGTEVFGESGVRNILECNAWLPIVLSWSVIGFECCYVMSLLLPLRLLVGLSVLAGLFHAGAARVMGLNNFVLAFVSTYPAIFHCWSVLHRYPL